MENEKVRDPLTERIIACCFKVHSELGPGFTENIYQNAMKIALKDGNLSFHVEKSFPVFYKGKPVGNFRADFIVADKVIVEIKAVAGNMPPVFQSQLLSYLRASRIKVGLLVNFGNKSCQIKRMMV